MEFVINRTDDDIPETLRYKETAKAYYGVVYEAVESYETESSHTTKAAEKTSLVIDEIIKNLCVVNWSTNTDIQNQMRNKIEDYLLK